MHAEMPMMMAAAVMREHVMVYVVGRPVKVKSQSSINGSSDIKRRSTSGEALCSIRLAMQIVIRHQALHVKHRYHSVMPLLPAAARIQPNHAPLSAEACAALT